MYGYCRYSASVGYACYYPCCCWFPPYIINDTLSLLLTVIYGLVIDLLLATAGYAEMAFAFGPLLITIDNYTHYKPLFYFDVFHYSISHAEDHKQSVSAAAGGQTSATW